MSRHASPTRRDVFRRVGRIFAGTAAVALATAPQRSGADDVDAPSDPVPTDVPIGAGSPPVDAAAVAGQPAERGRLAGQFAFPLSGFVAGDLVCLNNFGTCRRNHLGVDIGEARRLDAPIDLVACVDGEITQRDQAGRPGKFVVLRGDDDRWYRYHHLDEFADGVEVGTRVTVGQTLGTMGTTGNTIWPHLHFEVWIGDGAYSAAGTALDPVPLMPIPGEVHLDPVECR